MSPGRARVVFAQQTAAQIPTTQCTALSAPIRHDTTTVTLNIWTFVPIYIHQHHSRPVRCHTVLTFSPAFGCYQSVFVDALLDSRRAVLTDAWNR